LYQKAQESFLTSAEPEKPREIGSAFIPLATTKPRLLGELRLNVTLNNGI
jgi:hypothetical protein